MILVTLRILDTFVDFGQFFSTFFTPPFLSEILSRKLPYRLATKFLTPFLVRLCRLILLLSSGTLLSVDLNTYSSESCSTGVKGSVDSDML